MPKQLTVFYSWQSDTPSNLNRNFIERALEKALKRLHSDAGLQLAERPKLDKDTKDVPGSPPIADTILQKIDNCAAFVADLTFVGKSMEGMTNSSGKPRSFPNPNVLIEHGYALKCRGHGALVGIMNTAYGEPNPESLPFDLRHLRFPVTYNLTNSSSGAEKADQSERLTTELVIRLRPILANYSGERSVVEFIPRKTTRDLATFWDEPPDLLPDDGNLGRSETVTVPYQAKAYLRLQPSVHVPSIDTEMEAANLASTGNLRPLGPVDGYNRMKGYGSNRNAWGALVFESPKDGVLYHFSQLFLSREIWGVDASSVNAVQIRNFIESTLGPPIEKAYIASGLLEANFVVALESYLEFAKRTLNLPLPLRIEAGLVGIKGYAIAVNRSIGGKALHDQVSWCGDVLSYDARAYELLAPFFKRVWAECGFSRPDSRQAELTRQFGGKD